jgi:hypothetical protein
MTVARGVVAPNLPLAPSQYEMRYQDQLNNVLRLYFTQITNRINTPIAHASYYDTTTQTNPVADTVNVFSFNSVISEFGLTRGVPQTKIYVSQTGVYNFQFSFQLDVVGGGNAEVYIWPRINGVNVPDSASKVVIDGPNAELVPAWNFLLVMEANDYFELAWQSPDTDVVAPYVAPTGNIPGIPSVILTVTWISNYEASE